MLLYQNLMLYLNQGNTKMKNRYLVLSISHLSQPARKPLRTVSLALRQRFLYERLRRNNTGKFYTNSEMDLQLGVGEGRYEMIDRKKDLLNYMNEHLHIQ